MIEWYNNRKNGISNINAEIDDLHASIHHYAGTDWNHILAKQGENTFADFLNDTCNELARLTKENNPTSIKESE